MWHDREDQSVVKSYATTSENCTTAETIVQTLGWSKENTSDSQLLYEEIYSFFSVAAFSTTIKLCIYAILDHSPEREKKKMWFH